MKEVTVTGITTTTVTIHAEVARREPQNRGWTLVPDIGTFRTQVTKDYTGQYVSYFDPELRAVLIVLHSRMKEALGI